MSATDGSDRLAGRARPASGQSPDHPATSGKPAGGRTTAGPFRAFALSFGKTVATLAVVGVAILACLVIWDFYVSAPWTRDGRIRVQVASVAPQVSGQITELRVSDNQYVHKGDVLYAIDRFDFQASVEQAKQTLTMKAADVEVKKKQSERRKSLSDLATTSEEQQQYAGSAVQAQAAFEAAQSQLAQADINLKRTEVRSPVTGFVTNLLMRVGDYAHEGTANISVIDADSYWIDGYFEETKLAHICVGDRAEAQLMGYARPILGRVDTVTRGISVSDAAPSTQGLPSVDPVYTWVRLAQRVPVRIAITDVPPGVPLVSGLTATVTIRGETSDAGENSFGQRWSSMIDRLHDAVYRPQPRPACIPTVGGPGGSVSTLPTPKAPTGQTPAEIAPGVAPGLAKPPQAE